MVNDRKVLQLVNEWTHTTCITVANNNDGNKGESGVCDEGHSATCRPPAQGLDLNLSPRSQPPTDC